MGSRIFATLFLAAVAVLGLTAGAAADEVSVILVSSAEKILGEPGILETEGWNDCGSRGRVVSVTVENCTLIPCAFATEKLYDVEVQFMASISGSDLHLHLYAIYSGVEITLLDTDVRGTISPGNEYRIPVVAVVTQALVDARVEIRFELWDKQFLPGNEVCIGAPTDVVQAIITQKFFLDITVGGFDFGRIIIGCFGTVVPRTVNNFATYCLRGSPWNNKSYNDTTFFHVEKNGVIKGGDTLFNDGTGFENMYSQTVPLADENFSISHRSRGYVSLTNRGTPNTNGAQFFFTGRVGLEFDGKNVAFCRILEGIELLAEIEELDLVGNRPILAVGIRSCGIARS